ncbi:hypothetical protein FCV25MIE_07353 [Fagus crenata]
MITERTQANRVVPVAMRTSRSFRWRVGSGQRLNPERVSISPSLLAFFTSSSPAFGYSMKPISVQVRRLHPMGFGHGLLHHKPPEPPCLIENPYQIHQYHADRVTLVVNQIDSSHFCSVGRDSNGSLIYASTKRFIGAEAKAAYSAISTSHSFLHGSLFFKAILV